MLTLTRKTGEAIRIGEEIRIVVREVRGRQVRIGIEAPADVLIVREEIYLRVAEENRRTASPGIPNLDDLQAVVDALREGSSPSEPEPEPAQPEPVVQPEPSKTASQQDTGGHSAQKKGGGPFKKKRKKRRKKGRKKKRKKGR